MKRIAPFLLLASLVAWGCRSEPETASAPASPDVGAQAEEAAPTVTTTAALDPSSIWGSYEVESTTGEVENGKLRGTAQTQLVMATVPGVDTGFVLVPRDVGTRRASAASLQRIGETSGLRRSDKAGG